MPKQNRKKKKKIDGRTRVREKIRDEKLKKRSSSMQFLGRMFRIVLRKHTYYYIIILIEILISAVNISSKFISLITNCNLTSDFNIKVSNMVSKGLCIFIRTKIMG